MRGSMVIKAFGLFLLIFLFALYIRPTSAERPHGHEGHGVAPATGPNPLIEEMIILDRAFANIVSAVALGEGGPVIKAVTSLHGAKEKTHEGIHTGTVRLPRNQDRIEEFVRLDIEFHERLEELVHASGEGDTDRMLALTKELLDRCLGCHRVFRR